jgi:hypothetical protein
LGSRLTGALAPGKEFLLISGDAGLGDQKVVYDPELLF